MLTKFLIIGVGIGISWAVLAFGAAALIVRGFGRR